MNQGFFNNQFVKALDNEWAIYTNTDYSPKSYFFHFPCGLLVVTWRHKGCLECDVEVHEKYITLFKLLELNI